MVIHKFICDECNVFAEDTSTEGVHVCPQCKGDMRWDMRGIGIHGNYKSPIHSDAMAIAADQVEEHQRLFPNIRLDEQCRPIFENYTDHEAYLKANGFIKRPKKIKVEAERIY